MKTTTPQFDNAKDSAFPYPGDPFRNGYTVLGLSKREWMAGLALQGVLAGDRDRVIGATQAAGEAVEATDALLKELSK